MRWSTKPYGYSATRLGINPDQSDLVAGWNMIPESGAIIDQSATGVNGTIVRKPVHAKSILGESFYFNGVDDHILVTNGFLTNCIAPSNTLSPLHGVQ